MENKIFAYEIEELENIFFKKVKGIEKKEIKEFIKEVLKGYFGSEDFYYSYFYKNKNLYFIGVKTDKNIEGKKEVLFALKEGKYFYRKDASLFLYIEVKDDDVKIEVYDKKLEGYKEIEEKDIDESKLKKVKEYKYNLKEEERKFILLSIIFFLTSFLLLFMSYIKFKNNIDNINPQSLKKEIVIEEKGNADKIIPEFLSTLEKLEKQGKKVNKIIFKDNTIIIK